MGRRRTAWKTPDISADGLKLFAWAAMLLADIGIAVVEYGLIRIDQYTQESLYAAMEEDARLMTLAGIGSVLQLLGGLAIPLFAFLLTEGFRHTSDFRRYVLRMGAFALISELPYDLALRGQWMDWSSQNALVSLTVCLLMLWCLRMAGERAGAFAGILRLLPVFCAVLWVTLLRAQYGLCLVLLTAVFYLFDARPVLKTVLGAVISLLYVTGPLAFYGIWCYTGERKDRLPKMVWYVLYPVHLLILGGVVCFLRLPG